MPRRKPIKRKPIKQPVKNNHVGSAKSITLAMIVKNESRIIERLLDSCKGIIKNVCIVDTGSDDNTIEVIENWCTANKMNFVIPQIPFKNFGYNRTRSFQLAREHFPTSDYFILLDADMILKANKGYESSQLENGHYLLEQISDSSRYWNTRLIANKKGKVKFDWKCVGVTHEYWSCEPDADTANYNGLYIDDREDGGAKSDKFIRDNRLFKEELVKDNVPDDIRTRYHYYLGQTLMSLGKREEAIMYFTIRSNDLNSFEEEAWYAKFRVGECYKAIFEYKKWQADILKEIIDANHKSKIITITDLEIDDWKKDIIRSLITITDDTFKSADLIKGYQTLRKEEETNIALAVHNYLLSYDRRSWRIEPLYDIICYYRERANNRLALLICKAALDIKFPKDDTLFVSYTLYEYKIDLEIAINAYYVPDMKYLGEEACRRMLNKILAGKVNDDFLVCHMYEQSKWYPVDKLRDRCKVYLKKLAASGQIVNSHVLKLIENY